MPHPPWTQGGRTPAAGGERGEEDELENPPGLTWRFCSGCVRALSERSRPEQADGTMEGRGGERTGRPWRRAEAKWASGRGRAAGINRILPGSEVSGTFPVGYCARSAGCSSRGWCDHVTE